MNTQYRKNLKAVATACKNYTDTEIKKSEERIKWYIGEYQTTTQDDNTTAYQKTVPSGATRVKIKRIYGNTLKYNPSVASDTTVAFMKTLPDTVYTLDVSYVYGASEVSENTFVIPDIAETTSSNITWKVENGTFYLNGTANASFSINLLQYCTLTTNVNIKFFDIQGTSTKSSITQINSTYSAPTTSGTSIENLTTFRFFTDSGQSFTNYSFKIMVVRGTTPASAWSLGYTGIHNFAWNGIKVEVANKWKLGYEHYAVNANGVLTPNNNWNVSKLIRIEPNTQYTISGNTNRYWHFFYYDKYMNFISYNDTQNLITKTITTPNNAYYMYSQVGDSYSNVMLNIGSTALPYEPYVSQTLPIDLTSIEDSGGNKLFADGSLKGVGNVADEITPYKATKKMIQKIITLTTNNVEYESGNARFLINLNEVDKVYESISIDFKCTLPFVVSTSGQNNTCFLVKNYFGIDRLICKDTSISTNTDFINKYGNVLDIVFRTTPIEVSIDWSATLRGIQGYSNGTITLENTYNMDTANTITYNSIIKENCCSKIVQTRGGNVVKTINLPTQASDGYSAGSVSNVRDFTTNKRGTNVNKNNSLGSLDWFYQSGNTRFRAVLDGFKKVDDNNSVVNALCNLYDVISWNALYVSTRGLSFIPSSDVEYYVYVKDQNYTDVATFTLANTNVPLYYELADASKTETDITAIENVIEVEPNDVLSFYNSADELVTIPSDLTYRIEVAR